MTTSRKASLPVGRLILIGSVVAVFAFYAALVGEMAVVGWDVLGRDNAYLFEVAQRVVAGAVPYRDFTFEYPPLALVTVVLPYLAGGIDLGRWSALLAAENLVLVVATAVGLAYLARRGWSVRGTADTLIVYALLVAATPILFLRFDSLPALLTVIAMCAVASRRPVLAGIALSLGGFVKLYPLLLAPLFALPSLLSRKYGYLSSLIAGTAATLGVGLIGLIAVAGPLGLSFLTYHARPWI